MLKEGNKIGEEDEVTSPSKNKCPSEGYAKQNTLPDRSAMQAKVGGSDGGRGGRRFRLLGDAREGDRLVVLPDGERMNSALQTMHVDEVLLASGVREKGGEEGEKKKERRAGTYEKRSRNVDQNGGTSPLGALEKKR